ncbi:D-aminoacyl-tRNA deacylase [Metallibacterium sp.]|uniref:D-aminoacyl-tRNA deacylase n=1 Tax=Metallibacterium sp. TaxID=2940281 RepID=UPI0026286F3A|nr:D-aminoacyl-tRNA deacylase [Metallibacterium sp.]
MIALIQRVQRAHVEVQGAVIGQIAAGLLALVAVQPEDGEQQARRLLDRILGYRVFADSAGRMNLSLSETGGGLLLISQFTLAADTRKGMRASFTAAAPPAPAEHLFRLLLEQARARHAPVASGRFGADMQVHLVNDGPVTFWLEAH